MAGLLSFRVCSPHLFSSARLLLFHLTSCAAVFAFVILLRIIFFPPCKHHSRFSWALLHISHFSLKHEMEGDKEKKLRTFHIVCLTRRMSPFCYSRTWAKPIIFIPGSQLIVTSLKRYYVASLRPFFEARGGRETSCEKLENSVVALSPLQTRHARGTRRGKEERASARKRVNNFPFDMLMRTKQKSKKSVATSRLHEIKDRNVGMVNVWLLSLPVLVSACPLKRWKLVLWLASAAMPWIS